MPEINDELIQRIGKLAKLEFSDQELPELKVNLGKILNLVEKLNEVDTSGVDPLIYMNNNTNMYREDDVKGEISKVKGLENAPDKDSDYIKVPKVIKK